MSGGGPIGAIVSAPRNADTIRSTKLCGGGSQFWTASSNRDVQPTRDAMGDHAVDERHSEPLRQRRSDLSAAGPVCR